MTISREGVAEIIRLLALKLMFSLKNKKRDQNLLTGCLHNVPVIMCNMSAVVKPYFIEIVNFSQKTGNDQKVLIFRFS